MTQTTYILLGVTFYIVSMIIIVIVLNLVNKKEKKHYQDEISALERNKNLIISASILSELNKVESLINNEAMKEVYDSWQERFKKIKDEEVPKITDELIEIEDLYNDSEYKELKNRLNKIELEIYYVKNKANDLLNEIKEVTLSEERNRETITKLKSIYREIITKYNNNRNDYKEISAPLDLQFENVDKLFSAFEVAMDNNSYTEVSKIIRAIDDTIGNLNIIIEEAPSIILMGRGIIPKKIQEIKNISQKMYHDGYNLDYLNINYNISEVEKKINDIFTRLSVLNVEDSIFELKTIIDYFDSMFHDFDKERTSRKIFEEYTRTILVKTKKMQKINNDLLKKIESIKFSYDLTDEDVEILNVIKGELNQIEKDYNDLIAANRSKSFAYSRLGKEIELLNVHLTNTEDKLETSLRTLGSLKEDELRAREQLDEIRDILKKAKIKVNSYKLPTIPKVYYVQLAEATLAIKELIKELEKTPISIKIVNTRVDTARDLVLKLYNTTNETIKTAAMAETAIMYGNRYRPVNNDVDLGLTKAENSFYKGNFKSSLENAINALNLVEPGIHKKLLDYSQNKG